MFVALNLKIKSLVTFPHSSSSVKLLQDFPDLPFEYLVVASRTKSLPEAAKAPISSFTTPSPGVSFPHANPQVALINLSKCFG